MTDQIPTPLAGPLPTLAQNLAAALAQKAFAWLAAALVAHGWLAASGQQQFVEAGAGFALALVSIVWTWAHEKKRTATAQQALAAPPAGGKS